MQSNFSKLFILLIILILFLPLNSLAQREKPTKKTDDRIENRFPKRDEIKPDRNETERKRPNQTTIPKEKNPPQSNNDNVNPPYDPDPPYDYYNPVQIIVEETIIVNPPYQPEPEVVNINYKSDGIAKYKDGEYLEAFEYLNIAIGEDSTDYELYYYRGLAELKIKFFEEAKDDFTKYLEYYFYEPDGYFQRGLAKFYLNEKEVAKPDFQIAADMDHKLAISILKRFY